ncbi:MAG TPA: DUF885 domain-containing protein [Planctomycetaceae bacterium]|nr:DUF885 domain-containing protein [Planctomycetaceae bacterium]HRF02345.1 DUF885 family protein [Pirellulaceae bacterium]
MRTSARSTSFRGSLLIALLIASTMLTVGRGQEANEGATAERPRRAAVDMRDLIERFTADRSSVAYRYRVPMSQVAAERRERFREQWLKRLERIDFDRLSRDGQIDWLLLRNLIEREAARDEIERAKDAAIADLLPFATTIVDLAEVRENGGPIDPQALAGELDRLHRELSASIASFSPEGHGPVDGIRAARRTDELRRTLGEWFRYYDGYDPLFSWWCRAPYEAYDATLKRWSETLSRRLAGLDPSDSTTIVGEPLGREALEAELRFEMIPYSPEELVEIAEREFAWCDEQMAIAAKELGYDDWRDAQEEVKNRFVPPGDQPRLIRELAEQAVEFVEARDLVTIPPLCKETWRMEMMSPERQKVSPFFLGGPAIIVSYPTDEMSHPDKLMSLRGNNPHFSHATVQHELIPGHHLQQFMTKRHRAYREIFETPFWVEGWALYWEMRLWDLGFSTTPEDRIGMLFWRKHRCARIIFSLSYHLGTMSPQECIDYLVDRVGHERANAEAEVRRSIMGGYGPLYQAAYMLGGLQIRALHGTQVGPARMTERRFHDLILQQNAIPIELIRLRMSTGKIDRDWRTTWRFADP